MSTAIGRTRRVRGLLLFVAVGLCAAASNALAQGSVATDRAALVALYNATNGSSWTINTNWLSDAPLSEWFGVQTDRNGRVIQLDLDDPIGAGNGNNLQGSIPSELGQLTELRRLLLGYNDLAGPLPAALGNLRKLTLLHLEDSGLTGPIPAELGNLTNLTWLALALNQLTGPIPVQLGNLANMENLALFRNRLTGPIPVELGRLRAVESLQLSNNQLTGPIPTELGSLTQVTRLALNSNRLTGSIPAEIGNLTNLIYLYLDENQLAGPISAELGSLVNLTKLTLDSDTDTGLCLASNFPLASVFAQLAQQSSVEACMATTTPTETGDDAPQKVVIRTSETTSTTDSITFSWVTPGSGESALIDYQLEYLAAGEATSFTNNIKPESGTTQAYTIPAPGDQALKAGTTYQIRVRAQNRTVGYGPWSDYHTATTKSVPGPEPSPAVSKMVPPMVEAGDKMLMVSWTEPASEKSITHYQVDYKTASAAEWMDKPIDVTALNYTIGGLVNDTAYLVRVRAVDSGDRKGVWSDNGSGTPMGGIPTPTPALPLFGAFGLGAGLLAAGRARMRRQA